MQRFGEEIFPENNAEWFIFVTPYCHKRNRSDGAALLHPKSAGDKKLWVSARYQIQETHAENIRKI